MKATGGGSTAGSTLGDLAHDLRSALSAATAYLDLARERLDRGEAVEDEDLVPLEASLDKMARAVDRLDALGREAKP